MMKRSRFRAGLKDFCADERGASAIEYGLIAGGIFVAISAIIYQLGGTLETNYQAVDDGIKK